MYEFLKRTGAVLLALVLTVFPAARVCRAADISGSTVFTAAADGSRQQSLYLWEEGNMPSSVSYTVNDGNYPEGPEFRPYLVTFPVPEGIPVKGALLINAGGAFSSRIDWIEGTPVAREFSRRGYQCFVVNYRLIPYSQADAAVDLARAVRFVRRNASVYRIDPEDIAAIGFSAGGMMIGEMLEGYDGTVNGSALGGVYTPDSLDGESADLAAGAFIYSYIGSMEGPDTDAEKLRKADFPFLYYCYGTADLYLNRFEASLEALANAGIPVTTDVLKGQPHSFGLNGGWVDRFDTLLTGVFEGRLLPGGTISDKPLREQKLVPLSDGTYALLKGQHCSVGSGWYSDDSRILRIYQGLLTAGMRGEAVLSSQKQSLRVRVLSPVPKNRLLKLRVGESCLPELIDRGTSLPLSELGARVSWTVRDTAAARMIDGKLVAVRPGITRITGEFCGRRFSFTLHVLKPFERRNPTRRLKDYSN